MRWRTCYRKTHFTDLRLRIGVECGGSGAGGRDDAIEARAEEIAFVKAMDTGQAIRFIAKAGAAGGLKPAEFSPLSARLLVEIAESAGLPVGVWNLLSGFTDALDLAETRWRGRGYGQRYRHADKLCCR